METIKGEGRGKGALNAFMGNYSIALVLVLVTGAISLMSNRFFTVSNLFNMLRSVSIYGIMAFGMTYVIIGGGIDLSIGSIMSLCMINAVLLQPQGVFFALVTTVVLGLFAGFINGLLIGKIGANALIVTLSTQILYQAAALIYSGGYNQLGNPESTFNVIGRDNMLGVPILIWILIGVMVLSQFVLSNTTFGRRLYITGSNSVAAGFLGIRTQNILMFTYVISGFMCSISAIMLSSRLTSAQPTSGAPYLFDVFTAVILGGTSLSGGKGSCINTIIGIFLLGVISNGMMVMSVPFSYQQMIKGVILVLAVIYDSYNRERKIAR